MNRQTLAIFTLIVVAAFAARGRAEVVVESDVEFSNPEDQHLKLNLAHPKDLKAGEQLPAVVCIHGGGFRAGGRKTYDEMIKRLADGGYVAVTIEYRLAPKFPFPAAVQDCKAAVRWMRTNAEKYHVDPNRIGCMGGSAGGNLVLMLGVAGDAKLLDPPNLPKDAPTAAVQCVVDYFGPSDLTRSYGRSIDAAEVLPLYFGGDVTKERQKHILGSPLYWVTPAAPPMLLLHGTADANVNIEQSEWLRDKLKSVGAEVEMITYEGAGHGFKNADTKKATETKKKADDAAVAFFDKHFKK